MLTFKRTVLALLVVNQATHQPLRADADEALAALAGGAVLFLAGYGFYKLHEHVSYQNAQHTTQESKEKLRDLEARYCKTHMEQELFDAYHHNLDRFDELNNRTECDLEEITALRTKLRALRRSWAGYGYAQRMVDDAEEVLNRIRRPELTATQLHELLEKLRPLVALETMFAQESGSKLADLVNARDEWYFEREVTATYSNSQWPFLSADDAVTERGRRYQKYARQADEHGYQYTPTARTGHDMVARYAQTHERIVTNPRYTQDKQYKQQYDNEQERLRIERERLRAEQERAQAAQRQAQAAERQARLAREQNIQRLKERLFALRLEMNNTRAAIDATYDHIQLYHLKERFNLLRDEALRIRNELYGYNMPDIILIFADIFNATAYYL